MRMLNARTVWRPALLALGVAGFATPYHAETLAAQDRIQQGSKAPSINFQASILPIFKARCAQCHSGARPQAGLDLLNAKAVRSSRIVIPGDVEGSKLWKRLHGYDGLAQMPKGFSPLSSSDLAIIGSWIEDGASFDEAESPTHWAYVPVTTPALPMATKNEWVRNPIDGFILERLTAEGLQPSKEASKPILLRRAYLTLIGLPPTPEDTKRFLADKSPNAYERAVDSLLASKHYGEQQARWWLDLARYADTQGYEKDGIRTAWKYRDWVIDAFNRNLPFDQFTIEQLAGDMLPSATRDQLVATGFHRNTMQNEEGGVDPAEARHYVLVDRVNTTATVWMGSTLGCARCHDHKFDPFTQRDYYGMYAIFANTTYRSNGVKSAGEERWVEPDLRVPSPDQAAQELNLLAKIARQKYRISKQTPESIAESEQLKALAGVPVAWAPVKATASSAEGATLTAEPDGVFSADGPNPDRTTYSVTFQSAKPVASIKLTALPKPGTKGPGRSDSGNFILNDVRINGEPGADARTSFTQGGYSAAGVLDGKPETGWAVSPRYDVPNLLIVDLQRPITGTVVVELVFADPTWPRHSLAKFKLESTSEKFALRELETDPTLISPTKRGLRQELAALEAELSNLRAQIPTALVLREGSARGPLKAPLFERGEFLRKSGEVLAATPEFLKGRPTAGSTNRKSLAKWLVSRDNPLTARVQVNRFWEQAFGKGIVETSEDFGTQGAKPTHPALIDWLASRFMDSGWDMKALMRLIVTSATFRQSSATTPALIERDPKNELYARGPRFRMEAEMIRDNALAASGLLDRKIGGPSVMPYQPEGIWNSPYSGDAWVMATGGDAHRRGLYTFWKRTAPYPSFMAFDAGSREECLARRSRTNTPLQALTLLNDPVMMEAASALAIKAGGVAGIPEAFQRCTGRPPTAKETATLEQLYRKLLARFQAEPSKLASTPEAAAMIMVASTLLNLDETITRT